MKIKEYYQGENLASLAPGRGCNCFFFVPHFLSIMLVMGNGEPRCGLRQ